VQREIEVGLQRRLRRELQVDPLIICLVQPAPAGTPAYKGRADAEPDSRPARRDGGRSGGRDRDGSAPRPQPVNAVPQRQLVSASVAASPVAVAAPSPAAAPAPAAVPARESEPEMPANRTRRRRSTAAG